MESDYYKNKDETLTLKDDIRIKEFCDLPVLAFVKIIIGINMSNKLAKYRKNIELNERESRLIGEIEELLNEKDDNIKDQF